MVSSRPIVKGAVSEIRIWVYRESNAIIEYLVEMYDKDHKISAAGKDRFVQRQWLYFQASGQG
jgi:glutathione S-transferase